LNGMNTRPACSRRHAGFTLIEAVVVIVISGIIAVMVAVFMRTPVEGYFDSVRRAEMTDAADTALRRMARDVRAALPNSLRTGATCFEFLPAVAGGRYRAQAGTGAGPFDPLVFNALDNGFDVLGSVGLPLPAGTYHLVIYNDNTAAAYAGNNRSVITSSSPGIGFAAFQFPFESPSKRFQVIEDNAVVFSCVNAGTLAGDGTGTLNRSTRPIASAMGACPGGGTVLVSNVSACSFDYNQAVFQRNGLLTLTLELTRSNEKVRIYQEVHVDNAP